MFDPSMKEAIDERVGPFEDQVSVEPRKQPADALESQWDLWKVLTSELLDHGVSQQTLCSTTGEIVAAREAYFERARTGESATTA